MSNDCQRCGIYVPCERHTFDQVTVDVDERGTTVLRSERATQEPANHEAQRLFAPVDVMPGQTGLEI